MRERSTADAVPHTRNSISASRRCSSCARAWPSRGIGEVFNLFNAHEPGLRRRRRGLSRVFVGTAASPSPNSVFMKPTVFAGDAGAGSSASVSSGSGSRSSTARHGSAAQRRLVTPQRGRLRSAPFLLVPRGRTLVFWATMRACLLRAPRHPRMVLRHSASPMRSSRHSPHSATKSRHRSSARRFPDPGRPRPARAGGDWHGQDGGVRPAHDPAAGGRPAGRTG